MGTTLLTEDWLEGTTTKPQLGDFTAEQRANALRDAAVWCRVGAPGGHPRALFSPQGPCAVGYAMLKLHSFPGDWLRQSAIGLSWASEVFTHGGADPRLVRAGTHIAEAANHFDSRELEACAERLELAAELIERAALKPEDQTLTDADVAATPSPFSLMYAVIHAQQQKVEAIEEGFLLSPCEIFEKPEIDLYDEAAVERELVLA